MDKVLIIGGSNIDYIGKSIAPVKGRDSNIGDINISFGGVGRNIAENLARLGSCVTFITSIGSDALGQEMLKELKKININVIMPDGINKTSGYMAIHNNQGEMVLGLCSQEIGKYITLDYLKENEKLIDSFNYIFLDTNLELDAIDYLTKRFNNKIIFLDVISTTKGKKIIDKIDYINYIKCNELEALSLFGENYFDKFDKNTLICTRGDKDVLYNIGKVIKSSKVDKVKDIKNVTGAGDAFFASFIYEIVKGKEVEKAVEAGKKAAALTLKVSEAVNKKLSVLAIEKEG